MLLLDANVLLYALREELPEHKRWKAWLEEASEGPEPLAACNATLATVVRIATSPKVFRTPTPLADVFAFVDALRDASAFMPLEPGPRHWQSLESLCRSVRAHGNLVMDAYLAALALEAGAELITADGDFARFAKLRFRNPLGG